MTKESFANFRFFQVDELSQKAKKTSPLAKNFVTYLTRFCSDLFVINDLTCYHDSNYIFKANYTGTFTINFTRKGYFTFETFRRVEEEYASRIMLEKPGCEYQFIQQMPGDGGCTVFSFTEKGFAQIRDQYPLKDTSFFADLNAFSTVVAANATADFLHYQILNRLLSADVNQFEIDCLVAEMVDEVIHLLLQEEPIKSLSANTIRYHVRTIERAKDFLWENFSKDITLAELAKHCYVSHFHFTRIFKQFCGISPFTYLQQIRLKNAEAMLRNTDLPVTDICYRSGFNRLDYFSAAFSKQFGLPPTKYKQRPLSRMGTFRFVNI